MNSGSAFRLWLWIVCFLAALVLYLYVREDYDADNPLLVRQMVRQGSEIVRAQETVRQLFRDGEIVEFRRSYVSESAGTAICGEVASGEAKGGRKDWQRFISRQTLTSTWLEKQAPDFAYMWSVYCRR